MWEVKGGGGVKWGRGDEGGGGSGGWWWWGAWGGGNKAGKWARPTFDVGYMDSINFSCVISR